MNGKIAAGDPSNLRALGFFFASHALVASRVLSSKPPCYFPLLRIGLPAVWPDSSLILL
jgi:hypothetical protein